MIFMPKISVKKVKGWNASETEKQRSRSHAASMLATLDRTANGSKEIDRRNGMDSA